MNVHVIEMPYSMTIDAYGRVMNTSQRNVKKRKKIFHIFDFPFAHTQVFNLTILNFVLQYFFPHRKSIFHATLKNVLRIVTLLLFYRFISKENSYIHYIIFSIDRTYLLVAESLPIRYFDRRVRENRISPWWNFFDKEGSQGVAMIF